MNNKGFTLVELIATVVILGIVASIGSYTVINLINTSEEENYKLLIDNVKGAAEIYYQECNYASNDAINCGSSVTLGELLEYGFLKGNKTNDDDTFTIVNPKDDENISSCIISVGYSGGKVSVNAVNPTGSCPTSY